MQVGEMKAWLLIIFTGVMFASLGLCTKFLTNNGVDPLVCARSLSPCPP